MKTWVLQDEARAVKGGDLCQVVLPANGFLDKDDHACFRKAGHAGPHECAPGCEWKWQTTPEAHQVPWLSALARWLAGDW